MMRQPKQWGIHNVFKSILAVSEGGPDAAMAFRLAGEIAGRFGASVEAAHYAMPVNAVADGMVGGMSGAVVAWDEQQMSARAAASKAAFAATLASQANCSFVTPDRREADDLLLRLRTSDLAVVARPGVDKDNETPASTLQALHETASPVLIAPPSGVLGDLNEVVIAWNASQQAASAVRLSLPLLKQAKRATIVVVGAEAHAFSVGRLKDRLIRHGIAVDTAAVDPGAVSARARGKALLGFTHERNASLLVMGAYGHGQMLEFFGLGGATAKIITACRVPVFVSH